MRYPTEILPNKNYKLIRCDLVNHYLIRYTACKAREVIFDDNTKQIKQEYICSPREQMEDLSTSLLGVYDTSHIPIELTLLGKTKFSEYCAPDEIVPIPEYETEFILNDKRGFWVILIKNIQGLLADYTQHDIKQPFKAKCSIQHTPVKWNYWHFSIRWELEEGVYLHKLPHNTKAKVAKRLGTETRALIAKFAEIDEPNFSQLEVDEYCK